jgi:hypothetical protein
VQQSSTTVAEIATLRFDLEVMVAKRQLGRTTDDN